MKGAAMTATAKSRKQNWHAGMTRAQHALATKILREHVRAYYKESADGTMGQPGSMWFIGSDGLAKCRAPSVREIVKDWDPTTRLH